jgi:hypothetical protein
VYWIQLVRDKAKWRAVVNMVMNLGFHSLRVIWAAEEVLASQKVCGT